MESGRIIVNSMLTGPLSVNTYIIHREGLTECVVIDPANAKTVGFAIREKGLFLTHILLTHGHFDHILGVAQLKEEFSAKVVIHENDAEMLLDGEKSQANIVGAKVRPCAADIILTGDTSFRAAGIEFTVIHTPGHTPGGLCYIIHEINTVFSGDTLFRLSVGRSDLPGGSEAVICESILYKLFTIKGDLRVLPGHMRETTLDFERKHNPYVRCYD